MFMPCQDDLVEVKEALARYERILGAKINLEKREGLQLKVWKGGTPLPDPFCWSDSRVHIFRVWFRPDLQLKWNWLEVHAKVAAQVQTRTKKWLSLKGRVEACAIYIFPLILYQLSVLLQPAAQLSALQHLMFSLL